MKREAQLRRRLQTFDKLSEVVGAMKSLAAQHFRSSRGLVLSARRYQDGVAEVLARVPLSTPAPISAPRGLLVVAADRGLCGDYNSRLALAAVSERQRLGPGPIYCLGRRALSILRRSGQQVDRDYAAPASVAGLTDLLLQVAHDVFGDYQSGKISAMDCVSARFEGAGRFSPICTGILPIKPILGQSPFPTTHYVSVERLAAVAIREFVFITLYQILLESLASEHGARLVAAESAGQWLKARRDETHRALTSMRRESATQEVLDIAAGARSLRRRHPLG